ncbi:hypothetical protein [Streptomyces sp. NPDC047000]|uniref:hypothetical protein n=1 Tax=Streptomyces sp. NPDC047000 TaxID=3155474 RepID=UPI0033D01A7F
MTHDPDQEHTPLSDGPSHWNPDAAPPAPPAPPVPPMPGHAPRAGGDWEVLAGPGGEGGPAVPLRDRWRQRSGRVRALTVAVAVAALALGGTVAYAAASGHSGSDAVPAAAGTSPSASQSPGGPGAHGFFGPWYGLGGQAVHGEATVKDRDTGKWVVRVWQRGTVQGTDGGRVTVRSEDGTRWTWTVGSGTTVRKDGSSQSGAGALKKGDTVLLAGTRSGDTRTASFVLDGAPGGTGRGDDGDGRGPFGHGHGPWDRGGHETPSPGPSGGGDGNGSGGGSNDT